MILENAVDTVVQKIDSLLIKILLKVLMGEMNNFYTYRGCEVVLYLEGHCNLFDEKR